MFRRKNKHGSHKLSESHVSILKKALVKLPFDSINESQVQSLLNVVEFVNVETTEAVVFKREMSRGLYIVATGTVEGVASTGVVIRLFPKGDFFGDLSTFFATSSPLTVRAQKGAELLFIKSQNVLKVFLEKPNLDVFQWFITRRYMDTAKMFQGQTVSKELAYQALQETPMFSNWSSDCLHFLVEQTLPEVILLFPSGSYICRKGDPACEIFILVQGMAKIISSDKTKNKTELVTISSNKASFCMGEEQYFNESRRTFDIKAYSPCLVLIVKKDHLDHLFCSDIQCNEERELHNLLSHKWKSFLIRCNNALYAKYPGLFHLEVISIRLWQAILQEGINVPFIAGFFHILFLSASCSEIDFGQEILSAREFNDVVVLLIKGSGDIMLENEVLTTVEAPRLYLPSKDGANRTGHWIKATKTSLMIKIPLAVIKNAQEHYPDFDVF